VEDDEDETRLELERALVSRYKKMIADGHAEHCMWRTSGCRDDVYRVQVIRPSVWQPDLRRRCQSIHKISSAVKNVTIKPVEVEDGKIQPASRLIKDLPTDILGNDEASADDETVAKVLTVALHGWRGSREAGSELLNCDACFQRIGLWMYQPDYKRSRPTSSDDETEEEAAVVDLLEMHREHCPWRNGSTQVASGSLAGLSASEILHRVVTTYARDTRRKSQEQVGELDGQEGEEANGEEAEVQIPKASREEVAKQDKERESRLRKLKSLFSVRRKSTKATAR